MGLSRLSVADATCRASVRWSVTRIAQFSSRRETGIAGPRFPPVPGREAAPQPRRDTLTQWAKGALVRHQFCQELKAARTARLLLNVLSLRTLILRGHPRPVVPLRF